MREHRAPASRSRRLVLSAIAGLLLAGASPAAGAPAKSSRADVLIYWSSLAQPDQDPSLRERTRVRPAVRLRLGANEAPGRKFVIIRGDPRHASAYGAVRQLFVFVVRNSRHRSGPWIPFEKNVHTLFHTPEPLQLTCGKISHFVEQLATRHMSVPPAHVRRVMLFSTRSMDAGSMLQRRLAGGHSILEMYFPELGKWVVLDADMGIIPTREGAPLSMLEVSRLADREVDFGPLGKDELRKGPKRRQWVSAYYRDARRCFGFNDKHEVHFLFQRSAEDAARFKRNFTTAYRRRCVLWTDPSAYAARFYGPPPATRPTDRP